MVHRFYSYELVDGFPAVASLRGCLAVRGHGDHSHLDWDVELVVEEGADACELARAIDRACCDGLRRVRSLLEQAVVAA